MTSLNVQNLLLARLSKHMMDRVFEDWASMIGPRVAIVSQIAVQHPDALVLTPVLRGDCAVVQTKVEGECEGLLTFVFPSAFVVELVSEMIMLPAEIRRKKHAAGLGQSDMEPFQELSNLLCGSCNNVFEKMRRHLRVSQSIEHLRVIHSPRGNLDVLERVPEGMLSTVRLIVELGGTRYTLFQTWQHELALDVAELFMGKRAA